MSGDKHNSAIHILYAEDDSASGRLVQRIAETVEQFERAMILGALEKFYWNKMQAATALGVTRRILAYKMQNLGIEKADRKREL